MSESRIDPRLGKKAFRHRWLSKQINMGLASQIREMRLDRGWAQEELARRCDMAQAQVNRYEDPSYGRFSLRTLQRIAGAFDVALVVRFAGWSAILTGSRVLWTGRVPSFEEEFGVDAERPRPRADGGGA